MEGMLAWMNAGTSMAIIGTAGVIARQLRGQSRECRTFRKSTVTSGGCSGRHLRIRRSIVEIASESAASLRRQG